MKKKVLILALGLLPLAASGQGTPCSGPLTLSQCLEYSVENNLALQKDRLGMETALQSKREILGSLLPQLNASGGMTYNIQKTAIAMPNFVNSMMPEAMRDPNADKYMTVTMGMDLSANWGVSLTQQLLNFSLFNAVQIARTAEDMSEMGVESSTKDVVAKTAALFYNAQILQYSMDLFDQSLELMDRMSQMMSTNLELGLVRQVDADRILVNKTNLETQKDAMVQALEVQKNLLKLQMGFPMTEPLDIAPVDIDAIESMIFLETLRQFDVEEQLPFKMLKQQQNILELQRKSAISETLPALTLNANYSQNYMGDHFYGETYHHFPVSMVSLNLRVPLFTGMSKTAKIKKAGIELRKSERDEKMLVQSLTMGYNNAWIQMEQNRNTVHSQERNQRLAQDVLDVTESNYKEGIASLSDLLNASSSLIQAQMNYVNALNSSVKSYLDLKSADGTIMEIKK